MTIIEAIDNQLARLRTRYARGPLPRFFSWWGGELVGFLPMRWRMLLAERSEALLIEIAANELVFWRQSGNGCVEVGRVAVDAPAEEHKAAFERVRAQIDDAELRVFYCIRVGRVLHRTLSLPQAAEANLRQVLAFEMDRQTPFKADQVYFDYRLSAPNAERQLQVELIAVPRTQLDTELGALTASGVALDGVDCWRGVSGGERVGINLLPAERRKRRRNMRLRLNLALVAAMLVLLVTVMLQSLANRDAALVVMNAEVEKAQNEAKQVAALKKTLQDTITSANFLSRKKQETPLMIELLNDLTTRLPDDTYLERMTVDDKYKVELYGLSSDASLLIDSLQKSTLLANATPSGSNQPDPRTKKERFTLSVEFRKKIESAAKEKAAKELKEARDHAGRKEGGGSNAPVAGSP